MVDAKMDRHMTDELMRMHHPRIESSMAASKKQRVFGTEEPKPSALPHRSADRDSDTISSGSTSTSRRKSRFKQLGKSRVRQVKVEIDLWLVARIEDDDVSSLSSFSSDDSSYYIPERTTLFSEEELCVLKTSELPKPEEFGFHGIRKQSVPTVQR